MVNVVNNSVNFGICVVNFKFTIERRQNNKMKEVQRHNFEFLRTEVLNLSIEEFADKIGVSKSSYQRMKSKTNDAEYYFSPIEKACELADISLDIFTKQYLTKELYKNRHKKTQAIVFSKKQLLAFLLFGVVISVGVLLVFFTSHTNQAPSANVLPEVISSDAYELNNVYYWTDKDGGSYHANRNCPIIKSRNNIESGSIKDAQKKKKFDPCDFCVIK